MQYSNCPNILGYYRSIIQDLQHFKFIFINNEYVELNKNLQNRISVNIIDSELRDIIDYLIQNDLGMFIDSQSINNFKLLDLYWNSYSKINNAILVLDFNKNTQLKLLQISLPLLNKLLCDDITLILYNVQYNDIIDILVCFKNNRINTITILCNQYVEIENNKLLKLFTDFPRLKHIKFYNCEFNNDIVNIDESIIYTTNSFSYSDYYIQKENFISNIELFTESQLHNTYFNRKVCIDADGNIKNSPEHERSFGSIKDTTIEEAIEKPGFKDLWFIHKEMIDVCKDCEFRHMCVDACIPLQRADGSWYRSQECNYNPYICKWDDEEGYQNLASCGVICNAEGYSIDHEKIASINQLLWEEEE
jgi:SPASM domain peptide maturase of grasp-with-spasm system